MERDEQGAAAAAAEATDTEHRKAEEPQQPLSPNALKSAATDCLNSWITYLQVLNNLSSAGLRLSQSLCTLSQQQNATLSNHCHTSWEELAKATQFASHSVKCHIAAAMQDMSIGDTFTESDAQRQQEHNQQIITENLLTFINLQYQFSLAGCECFGSMAMCPSCQSVPGAAHDTECGMAMLQQCFAKLHAHESHSQMSSPHVPIESPKEVVRQQQSPMNPEARGSSPYHEFPRGPSPIHAAFSGPTHVESLRGPFPNPGQLQTMKFPFASRGSRSPLHFPLFPLTGGQRRWSEAAAGEVTADSTDSSMRRWSMPWDSPRVEGGAWRLLPSKLTVPVTTASQERSQSTTPEAISQPATIPTAEGLAEAIQLLSCRPMRCSVPNTSTHGFVGGMISGAGTSGWPDAHEERLHRRIFPGMSSQRGNWQSLDAPQISSMSVTEHYDIFPPGVSLTSRKSSSSTDSSCLSIHSRSTTSSSEKGSDSLGGGGDAIRLHTNLYSMWSGSEHLPFIRLPESQEPQDESDEDTSTDKTFFPKPT